MSSAPTNTHHLFDLPAELKILVYEYLAEAVPRHPVFTSKVTFGLVPIFARVCKQAHNECMPIFLAKTDFIVEDRRYNPPDSRSRNRDDRRIFLKGIRRLGPDHVRSIRSITIEGGAFDLFRNLIDSWHTLLRNLVEADVQAHQLKWPGMLPERDISQCYNPGRLFVDTIDFYGNVLAPSLRDHNLLSPRSLFADIDEQATSYFGDPAWRSLVNRPLNS